MPLLRAMREINKAYVLRRRADARVSVRARRGGAGRRGVPI